MAHALAEKYQPGSNGGPMYRACGGSRRPNKAWKLS